MLSSPLSLAVMSVYFGGFQVVVSWSYWGSLLACS